MPDAFPVATYKDAASHLRRPFAPPAVKFKVQSTWDGGGMVVAYIDARLVVERLNLVCPHLWSDEYEVAGQSLICHLTVDGITRRDIGSDYKGKGLWSDALKRAAVKFGVGVSLYAIPQIKNLRVDNGEFKVSKGKTYLTDKGTESCKRIYSMWLDSLGIEAFGEPLDHGDSDDAVGDAEVEEAVAPDVPKEPQRPLNHANTSEEKVNELADLIKSHALSDKDKLKVKAYIKAGRSKPQDVETTNAVSLLKQGKVEALLKFAGIADGSIDPTPSEVGA